MAVALTTIRHGDDKGNLVVVEEGKSVSKLPKDVQNELKDQGLVGDPPVDVEEAEEEKAELQAEIDRLNAELAEARGGTPPMVAGQASAPQSALTEEEKKKLQADPTRTKATGAPKVDTDKDK